MEKLKLDSVLSKGKYANKCVSDLVSIKGKIISMIKDGYVFDDEVLAAAKIKKIVSNEKTYSRAGGTECHMDNKILPVDTSSVKQILAELNTIDSSNKKNNEPSESNSDYNNDSYDENYEESINELDESYE